MTIVQYLSAFRVYSMDALVLAFGVCICTSLLKKTVLKKCPKKVFVFLPFVLGFLFYAAFRAALTQSIAPFTEELNGTLEGGFACGCAATLYYVVYEQFFRTPASSAGGETYPVAALLSGVVPEEQIPAAAKRLTEGSAHVQKEDLFHFALETLRGYVSGDNPSSEAELTVYAATVAEFLRTSTT